MAPFALKARFIFPVEATPITDGVLAVDGQYVTALGHQAVDVPTFDVGNAAILPALVNAHTHLEFNGLRTPLGHPGMTFTDWIRLVLAYRAGHDLPASQHPRWIELGLEESIRSGVAMLGEIAMPGWEREPLLLTSATGIVFLELIGLSAARVAESTEIARRHIRIPRDKINGWKIGLSPHAPYTAQPELVAESARLSAAQMIPLAMHLAESREELRLLRDGDGPMRDLLVERDVWQPDALSAGSRPLDYLKILATAHRSLIVHGNYLDDEEIEYLARHGDRMSPVYCPRTHQYFDHEPYPLIKMLDAGIHVALGTDSRASSPDINLLEEMRFVARAFPNIAPETVVRMGTLYGAEALGAERKLGSLPPGKNASFIVLPLPDSDAVDPHQLVLDSEHQVELFVLEGRPVYAHASMRDLQRRLEELSSW